MTKLLTRSVVLAMTFILAILSLFWAVLFRVPQNMKSLTVAVVDLDGKSYPYNNSEPLIGPAVIDLARRKAQELVGTIGFIIRDPESFDLDPIAVRLSVYDENDWAAIVVNSNATALLQQAVATGNRTYDPNGAIQIIYNQARQEVTYSNYIIPQLDQFQRDVRAEFGRQWIQRVMSDASLNVTTYRTVPQALNPAIGFSIYNLRPFEPSAATHSVTIGLIYLIIISFFSFGFFVPHHTKFIIPEGHPPLHYWQLIFWRLFATILAYFLLSLAYSLVSLAFQVPFSNTSAHSNIDVANTPDAYGKASFVVYWMLNFVGMIALGLACENVTMIIGIPWTAMWLMFWVISNVSIAFYALPLTPGFYRYGYAFPLHHVVEGSRTIIFDLKSQIGLNFGVLFAWGIVNCVLFFPCCVFFRWKQNRERLRGLSGSHTRFLLDG